jgi:error-prone DNA polymerase
MATFKRNGDIHRFRDKFITGMVKNGYECEFAQRCFSQIEGFGTYGFPESHAASFALLVYVSAWIKCFYPEVFACALLNSQPMGFYAPAQIVRDAREHGVEVRPVDVNHSFWHCTLEPRACSSPSSPDLIRGFAGAFYGERAGVRGWALRLGFRQLKGFAEADAKRLVDARPEHGYREPRALWRKSGLGRAVLERLAEADAFGSIGLDRRRALWALKALGEPPLPLFAADQAFPGKAELSSESSAAALLPEMPLGEHVVEDYASLGLSLKRHPLAFLRAELAREGLVRAADLAQLPVDCRVATAGIVLIRQRPGSAKGVVFVTIEDETGIANLILWPPILERFRRAALGATLLGCAGKLQRDQGVIHIVAERLTDLTPRLHTLRELSGEDRPSPWQKWPFPFH